MSENTGQPGTSGPMPDSSVTEPLQLADQRPMAPALPAPGSRGAASAGNHTRTILEVVGGVVAAALIVAAGVLGFAVGHLTGSSDHDGRFAGIGPGGYAQDGPMAGQGPMGHGWQGFGPGQGTRPDDGQGFGGGNPNGSVEDFMKGLEGFMNDLQGGGGHGLPGGGMPMDPGQGLEQSPAP